MTPATKTAIATLQALHAPESRISRHEAKDAADGEAARAAIRHLWKPTEVNAITLALATRRPLLVRGEPGTGKTQLALAAAAVLGWRLHSNTLHARSEAQDLLYRFDAVRRLADAQANKPIDGNEHAYWEPQALWCGLDWASAKRYGSLRAADPSGQALPDPAGHVVLIDEIDKAPSDVPNGLLEVLGARSFAVSGLGIQVGASDDSWPLVIITTNEEQILPAAFLRRCVVLTHDLPRAGGYRDFLIEHGEAHFGAVAGEPKKLQRSVLEQAADWLVDDRQNAIEENLPPPGMAEYLDLLYALHALAPGDPKKQEELFHELNQYAFLKHRVDGEGGSRLRQDSSGRRTVPPRER